MQRLYAWVIAIPSNSASRQIGMTLFRSKYRVETTRLRGWDYGAHAWYFVTICTRNRICSLGAVRQAQVRLSAVGEAAAEMWCQIPEHHENVGVDDYIVMPNHVHGIVIIQNEHRYSPVLGMRGFRRARPERTGISPAAGSLAAVIRSYKSAVTNWCRKNGLGHFAWQARFHDRVIRGSRSLDAIRRYIWDNPMNWVEDEYYAAD